MSASRDIALRTVADNEHDAWLALCDQLETTGAVTLADRQSRVGARDTPGQRLFEAIRRWGELHADLQAVEEDY